MTTALCTPRRAPRAAALLTVALLTGCAAWRPAPPQGSPDALWQSNRQSLQCLQQWRMQGRMALAARDEGWSARLDWQQAGEVFQMRLAGPFGWGGFRLTGNRSRFTLSSGGDRWRFYASPERVIKQEFDMTVPVQGLRYWVLGLDRPDSEARTELDDYGRVLRLEQAGWTVEYDDYQRYDGRALPHRIVMTRPDLRLKLVVREWQFDAAQMDGAACPSSDDAT